MLPHNPWVEEQLARVVVSDRLREAHRHQMVREAMAGSQRGRSVRRLLGTVLIRTGARIAGPTLPQELALHRHVVSVV